MSFAPITVAMMVLLLLLMMGGIVVEEVRVSDNVTAQAPTSISVPHTNGEIFALLFVLLGLSACAAWFGRW